MPLDATIVEDSPETVMARMRTARRAPTPAPAAPPTDPPAPAAVAAPAAEPVAAAPAVPVEAIAATPPPVAAPEVPITPPAGAPLSAAAASPGAAPVAPEAPVAGAAEASPTAAPAAPVAAAPEADPAKAELVKLGYTFNEAGVPVPPQAPVTPAAATPAPAAPVPAPVARPGVPALAPDWAHSPQVMPDHTGQNIQVFKDARDPSGQVLRDIKGNLYIPKSEWEAAFASNPTQAQMAWTNWQIERGNNDMRWEGRVRDAAQTGLTAAKERVHTSLKQIPGFFEHPDTQAILRDAEAEVNKLPVEQRTDPNIYAAAATLLLAKDDMAPMKKIVSELLAKGQTVAQAQATQNRTVIASSAGAPTAPSAPPAPAGNHGLDADELEMARRFNMTPEKYAQNKVIQRIGR